MLEIAYYTGFLLFPKSDQVATYHSSHLDVSTYIDTIRLKTTQNVRIIGPNGGMYMKRWAGYLSD